MTGLRLQRSFGVVALSSMVLAVAAGAGLLAGAFPAWAQGVDSAAFLVVDGQTRSVYGYDEAGTLVGSFALDPANTRPSSVGGNGFSVYVLDQGKKRIYRYDGDGSLEAVSAELRRADGASLSVPGGMATDGDQLWVVDRGRSRVFRYSLDDAFSGIARLSAVAEISLLADNARAEGLALDGPFAYVLDETDKQVYRYGRYVAGLVQVSAILRQSTGDSLGAPSGVTVVNGSLFVSDRSRDKLFQYGLDELFSGVTIASAVSEFRLPPVNADARGLHHVGEAEHVSACALAPTGAAAPQAAPAPAPAPCEPPKLAGITAKHNDIRDSLNKKPDPPHLPAPTPNLGTDLKWNNALETAATTHAGTCTLMHSGGADGENISVSFGTPPTNKTIDDAIEGWNSERDSYIQASKAAGKSQTTYPGSYGHYTQLIWRETTELGCGVKEYCAQVTAADGKTLVTGTRTIIKIDSDGKRTETKEEVKQAAVLVCQYRKAGNTQGFHPYAGNRPRP